jgi:hypothetical protein
MSSEAKTEGPTSATKRRNDLDRRNMLFGTSALVAAATLTSGAIAQAQQAAPSAAAPAPAPASGRRPNILVIFGDDIGQTNISAYSFGLMGYRTPNIDRIAKEGMMFTDYYAEQSCTAGRSSFITGQCTLRTGLSKVGIPGATAGLQVRDVTLAELLKPLGYATGQFGKNHLGDRNEFLPTVHGFDEFYGNLYHLNAEEEPEDPDYPKDANFRKQFGPRGVLDCTADGGCKDTGPLTRTVEDAVVVFQAVVGELVQFGDQYARRFLCRVGSDFDRTNQPRNRRQWPALARSWRSFRSRLKATRSWYCSTCCSMQWLGSWAWDSCCKRLTG